MKIIECTELFPNSEWAQAYIESENIIRFNIQIGNQIRCIHARIDRISPFLDNVRRAQDGKVQYMSNMSPEHVEPAGSP